MSQRFALHVADKICHAHYEEQDPENLDEVSNQQMSTGYRFNVSNYNNKM